MSDVVDRIVSLMEANGVSGTGLSSVAGLSSSAVSEWKKGKAKPSADAVVKIAKHFNVTTDYLLIGADSGNNRIATPFSERLLSLLTEATSLPYSDIAELRYELYKQENSVALELICHLADEPKTPALLQVVSST